MTHVTASRIVATLLLATLSFPAMSQTHRATEALQVEVPFEPTAFASANGTQWAYKLARSEIDEPLKLQRIDAGDAPQRNSKPGAKSMHLSYELVLTNIGSAPITLQRIEIAGGNRRNAKPVAAYAGPELEALLAFPHRVYTTETVVEGRPIGTRHSRMLVIGPPLEGGNWFVSGGPGGKGATNYHRLNTFVLNGSIEAARRYAIDWVKVENGQMQSAKLATNSSYHGYGQEVLAVADGVIVAALDGIPENVPGQLPPLEPVAPVCILCGNHVVLELADGQFATYMHLQPGSLRVAKGDRVRRGQVLGLVGNSGNSSLPHLHFHVATAPGMTGQGLPYLIERLSIIDPLGVPQRRTRELPLDGMVVDFGS